MAAKRFRPLTEKQVSFELSIGPEHLEVEGNCMASGDEAFDRKCAEDILQRLDSGDECAWCCLVVTAEDKDGNQGHASLGAVSLEDGHPWGPRLTDYIRAEFSELWSEALGALNAKRKDAWTVKHLS